MSSFRDFAASNAPDTCLWCGRKLRWKSYVKKADTDKKPRKCFARPGDYTASNEPCGSTNIRLTGDGWYCENNHYVRAPRKIVERERVYDKPGDYGDGHFCNMSCGYLFGRAMAGNGRRLKPLAEQAREIVKKVTERRK